MPHLPCLLEKDNRVGLARATLPAVLERKLRFDDFDACDWLVLCTTPLPSFAASLALVCAPQHVSGEAIEEGLSQRSSPLTAS